MCRGPSFFFADVVTFGLLLFFKLLIKKIKDDSAECDMKQFVI